MMGASTEKVDSPREVTPAAPAVRRRLGRIDGPSGGPTLVVLGGIHGNEPAGVRALERVLAEIESSGAPLGGTFVALAGNLGALAAHRRYLDLDLNRAWSEERVARLRTGSPPGLAEEKELLELDREITAILGAGDGRTRLLDLHTTSGDGVPFVVLDDSLTNRRFAVALPAPLVLGLEEELAGTFVFRMTGLGVTSVAFESGQHDDPGSADRAAAAVWIALETAGLLPRRLRPRADEAKRLLTRSRGDVPSVVEVVYRHRITPFDGFRMRPGFRSFQWVEEGDVLADDRRGEVAAPRSGLILMPLYQPQGEDGFFLARPVASQWLGISAWLRRLRVDRWLAHLPGIRRDPANPDVFFVNRRVVRFFVREIFHLLGYKRLADDGGRAVFRRRADPA